MMEHHRDLACPDVISALAAALRARAAQPPGGVLDHLRGCPRCQAGLLLLLNQLAAHAGSATTAQGCVGGQADLAAYIELERLDPAQAAALYPQVWQHLWTCADCVAEYRTIQAMLDAEHAGAIPPLVAPAQSLGDAERVGATPAPVASGPTLFQQAARVIQRIRLTRDVLTLALPPLHIAGATMRGNPEQSFVLFDHHDGQPPRQLTVIVREQSADQWQMQVTVAPPLDAVLLVSIGAHNFTSRFANGVARINHIPARLVTDPAAPDLEIALVHPDQA